MYTGRRTWTAASPPRAPERHKRHSHQGVGQTVKWKLPHLLYTATAHTCTVPDNGLASTPVASLSVDPAAARVRVTRLRLASASASPLVGAAGSPTATGTPPRPRFLSLAAAGLGGDGAGARMAGGGRGAVDTGRPALATVGAPAAVVADARVRLGSAIPPEKYKIVGKRCPGHGAGSW